MGESGSTSAGLDGERSETAFQVTRPLRRAAASLVSGANLNGLGACIVNVDFDAPPLEVHCSALPRSGPVPLEVQFNGVPEGCIGPCVFTWDFGDGSPALRREANSVAQHTYSKAGEYHATLQLTDAVTGEPGYAERSLRCPMTISVGGPPDTTPPPPPPPGNHPPSIVSILPGPVTCSPGGATGAVLCQVQDPDGEAVTVTPSGILPDTLAFNPPSATIPGGSGTATFTFAVPAGTPIVVVECAPEDARGLAGTPASTEIVIGCGIR
jgi:hypothetical protein